MQPRQTLLEQFSTFAYLSGDRVQRWVVEPRLKRSMAHQLALHPEAPNSAAFWALFWHRHWRAKSHPYAEQHLFAYLQETCYWVAREVSRSCKSASYSEADYFLMAVAEIPLALEKFDPEKSRYMKAFTQVFLSNRVKSKLRQQGQADFCSIWGLLKKTSRKGLLEVLEYQGFGQDSIEQYRLLWMGFKALYDALPPEAKKRFEPDASFWQALTQFYNNQRLGQLSRAAPKLMSDEVESRLRQLAQWIRAYHYPKINSLNQPTWDEDGSEREDNLSDPEQQSLLAELIASEELEARQQEQLKLQQILAQAFQQLDAKNQRILCCFYRQGLSQAEAASQMGMAQPTISRRLKKSKESLLTSMLQAFELEMNNFPEPEQLKPIHTALEEWLLVYLQESDLCE